MFLLFSHSSNVLGIFLSPGVLSYRGSESSQAILPQQSYPNGPYGAA